MKNVSQTQVPEFEQHGIIIAREMPSLFNSLALPHALNALMLLVTQIKGKCTACSFHTVLFSWSKTADGNNALFGCGQLTCKDTFPNQTRQSHLKRLLLKFLFSKMMKARSLVFQKWNGILSWIFIWAWEQWLGLYTGRFRRREGPSGVTGGEM